jgi:exodeoxyribonuclease III
MPKLLTWNLLHGGGARRMPAIALSLLEHRADVVVLTEFRRTTGGQIGGVLADHGLTHQVSTDPPKGCNGVLIASRAPIARTAVPRNGRAPASTARRLAAVEIPDLGLSVAGLHIPPDGPESGREAVFQSAVELARSRREEAFLQIADFNSGRHHQYEEGATFTCTRLLGQIATYGYVDAFRACHANAREFTWYSHEGQGFRIDHAFLSGPLAPRLSECRYSHRERESGLSDHSALVVTLR